MPDLRQAFRTLGRYPGFAAIVILILAVGIGANTAMFSIVDGILLRSLPFREPDKLFAVQEVLPKFAHLAPTLPVSAHHFREWKKNWQSFESMALLVSASVNLTSNGEPERLSLGRASTDLFPLLGVSPQIGRNFLPEEDQQGRDRVVLITDSLWRKRFRADRSVLNQKILLDGVPYEVIGVLPPGLTIPKVSQLQNLKYGDLDPDIWKPTALRDQDYEPMGNFNFACIVRLKNGVSASQATDELNALQAGIIKQFVPEGLEMRAVMLPMQAQITGRSRQGLLLLLGAVGAVLLIVCINVANLLLTRATARRREFAVRAALGASSGRLMRQMMVESFLLAGIGGGLGIALAYFGLSAIIHNAPLDLPRLNEVHLDGRALAVAFFLSLGSAAFFGLLPAWRSSHSDPQEGLKSSGRSSTEGRKSGRLRSILVSLEVALSTVCLIAAGLLLNSFVRLMQVDKGFTVERITTVALNLPGTRYPNVQKRSEFLSKVLEAVKPLPGVTSVATANMVPLTGEGNNNIISAEGTTIPELDRPVADHRNISEDYFRALDIPLLAGRFFEPSDRDHRVGILSIETAERLWPHQSPLGKKFRQGDSKSPLMEVVGIVGDIRANSLQGKSSLTWYVPYWQDDQRDMVLVVRTAMDPASITGAVRGIIRSLDPELPVPQFRTMQEIVSASVSQRRFQLTLVTLFAGIGMILACLGIYGVVSYSVEQRRGEIGIRMALGATASNLQALVVRQGLAPVIAGLFAGVAAALALGRVLQGMLFGVKLTDPLTLSAVVAVLLGVGAIACLIPAMRATRMDPLLALRSE